MKSVLACGLAAGLLCAAAPASFAASAIALPAAPVSAQNGNIILAADGCGWGNYRGPYGACHAFGTGPYPNGYYNNYAYNSAPVYYNSYNGCPVGWWRGPWGHCRNTPYHGPLPGGGWQP